METVPERCCLCGETAKNLLIEEGGWKVYKCLGCGLGVLNPRPSQEDLAGLYDRAYYDREYAASRLTADDQPGSPRFRRRLEAESHRIRFFRGLKRCGTVLDVGCGYGYFLAACREARYAVRGVDFSGHAVEHAIETLRLPVTVGPLDSADLPEGAFDVITMWHCLEHAPDPVGAIEQVRRWLAPDGVLVIEVPNHEGTDAVRLWKNWVGWKIPYHLYHFTPSALKRLLDRCGFRVVRTKDYLSETVMADLKKRPVIGLFARTIARRYSGHSIAVAARFR